MNTKHVLMYLLLAVGGSWLPLGTPALAAPPPSCTSTQVAENFTGYSTNCAVVLLRRRLPDRRQHSLHRNVEPGIVAAMLE